MILPPVGTPPTPITDIVPEPGSVSPALDLMPKEINPQAREILAAQNVTVPGFHEAPENFQDAGGAKKIDLNAREKLGGFPAVPGFKEEPAVQPPTGFREADDLDVKSVDELNADRKGFDPVAYFAQNPDAPKEPKKFQKLLEVARRRYEEGLTAAGVAEAAFSKESGKTLKEIATSAPIKLTERAIDLTVQPIANVVLGTLTGDLFNKQKRDALFNETRKIVRKGSAEVAAGSESATVGLVDLTRTGVRKLDTAYTPVPLSAMGEGATQEAIPLKKPLTDQEVLRRLSDDASFRQNAEDILKGQGESAKNFGLDRESLAKQGIELDPEAIRLLSLVDPVTMVATGGAFKLVGAAGKVLGTAKTLAGAKYAVEKLAEIAKLSAGKAIQYSGTATKLAGQALQGSGKTAALLSGLGASIKGAGLIESLATAAAAKSIGPTARFVGEQAEHIGKALAGEVPISPNFQRLLDIVAVPTKAAATIAEGAAKGVIAAAPFAIAADSDEQAGTLLAVGGGIGAAHGAASGAFRVVKNAAARRYFGENRPVLEDVVSPGYGRDAALDVEHQNSIAKLSAQNASELNNFREILRSQGGEIYAVDQATFRQKVADEYKARTGKELTPDQLDTYEKNYAFFDETNGDKKVVYLNSDTTGLHHDSGHIFDALLSEETRAKLRTAVKEAFPKERIAEFKKLYEDWVGGELSETRAMDEFIAEQFAALFNNVPITEMNAPKSLLSKFIDVAAEGAEALGIDIGKGVTTPNLGAPVSVGIRKLFQNAAGDVIRAGLEAGGEPPTNVTPLPPTPAPAPPGTAPVAPPTNVVPLTPPPANVVPLVPPAPAPPSPPAPGSRNIRVTPEQVASFKQQPKTPEARAAAAARAAETGIDYARTEAKKAEGSTTSQIIERISDSMESGRPVVGIEHLGITSAGTPEGPIGATLRKAEQAGGYAALNAAQLDVRQNAPPEIVTLHSKNFVPVRWDAQGGSPTLIAMSLDKVISNILRIASDKTVQDLIPYTVENGKLTTQGWHEVVADAQAYSENQANGRKGDGGRLEVPEAGLSIPAENPAYTPQSLSPERANFQNLVQGLAPPQTSRAPKGEIPGNIKGQLLAEANRRPVELPAVIPTKQAGKQAFVEFPPRVVQEVNPLRNEMARRGVRVRDLLEVTERIRAKDIVSATPKPDINYKAPVTDVIRGGFLPAPTEFRQKNLGGRTVEEFSDYVLKASPAEWTAATENMTGGLTGGAWNLGLGLKDAADVSVLKSYADKFSDSAKAAMKAGDFDSAMSQVTRGQFFREAYEAATGTGSAGAAFKRGTAGMESAKPPFPIEATTTGTTSAAGPGTTETAKFQPKTGYMVSESSSLPGETAKDKLQSLWSWATEKKFSDLKGIWGNPLVVGPTYSPPGRPEILGSSLEGIKFPSNEAFVKYRLENPSTLSGRRTGYQHLAKDLLDAAREMDKNPLKGYAAGYGRRDIYGRPTLENGQIDYPRWQENNPALLIARDKNAYRWETNFYTEPTLLGQVFNTVRDLFELLKSNPDPKEAAYLDRIYQRLTLELEGQEPSRKPNPEKFEDVQAKVLTRLDKELTAEAERLKFLQAREGGTSAPASKQTPEGTKFQPKKKQTAGEYFQSLPKPETMSEKAARLEMAWVKGKKIEPAVPGDEKAREDAGWISAAIFPNESIGFGYHDDFPNFLELPKETQATILNYAKQQNLDVVYNGEGISKRDNTLGPDEKAFAFQPAEQLRPEDQPPDLSIVPTPAAAGGTPPIEPPAGTVIPPPIAAGAFQPRTDAGRKLEEQGFEIVPSGEMGIRRVGILSPDGEEVAAIQSVQRSPKRAEISMVQKYQGAPKGIGEVLYREVGAQLKDDGVTLVEGQIIAPEPLAIRKKIFGEFKSLNVNEEPATYAEALSALERARSRPDNGIEVVEPVNEITENTRFLPGKRDAQGRPLDKEGNIDYVKWQKEGIAAVKKQRAEPIEASTPKGPITEDAGVATGWILPDKKFVPLDAAFHEQYLADNSEALNKKFGTGFSDVSSPDDRLSALNAGFVRLRNYGGRLNVEANADKWSSLKSKVLSTLQDREAKFDSLSLSLLDNEGQQVDSTAALRLHEMTGPEKLNAIEEAVNSVRASGPRFLPIGEYWMDIDGKFIRAMDGHYRKAGEILKEKFGMEGGFLSDADSDSTDTLMKKGYSRVISGDTEFHVESMKRGLSDLNSKQRSAIEDEVLKRGQELVFNGKYIGGGGGFQPAGEGLPGFEDVSPEQAGRLKAKRRIAAVKKNNPEAVTPQYARDESGEIIVTADGNPKPLTLDYDFINSPVAKEAAKGLKGAAREEAAANALGDALTKLHRSVEDRPDIKAGAKWYSTARTRLKKMFGDDAKFFAELLGATSARTPVEINYRFALDAYNQFKAGAFDKTLAKYREGKKAWDTQDLGDFKGETRGQFMDYWVNKHDLGVTQASGKKYGMNSRAVLRVLDGSWAAEVQGPKTPNFAGNLTGETFEATIDVWAARLLHRLANEGKKDRWRILPENETGVTDADFYLGQAAYRNAAKQLGIKPDALQAILWFAEKDHWEKKGWTRGAGAAKSDFNVLLAETERTPEGKLQMKTPQAEFGLDMGASLKDIVKKKKK